MRPKEVTDDRGKFVPIDYRKKLKIYLTQKLKGSKKTFVLFEKFDGFKGPKRPLFLVYDLKDPEWTPLVEGLVKNARLYKRVVGGDVTRSTQKDQTDILKLRPRLYTKSLLKDKNVVEDLEALLVEVMGEGKKALTLFMEEEDAPESDAPETLDGSGEAPETTREEAVSSPELEELAGLSSVGDKRKFIMAQANKIPAQAKEAGLSEDGEYKKLWFALTREVRGGKVDAALGTIEILLKMLAAPKPVESEAEPETVPETIETTGTGTTAETEEIPGLTELLQPRELSKLEAQLNVWRLRVDQIETKDLPKLEEMEKTASKQITVLEKQISEYEQETDRIDKEVDARFDRIIKISGSDSNEDLDKLESIQNEINDLLKPLEEQIKSKLEEAQLSLAENAFVQASSEDQLTDVRAELKTGKESITKLEKEIKALTK